MENIIEKEELLSLLAEKKYPEIKRKLEDMNPHDCAALLSDLEPSVLTRVFRLISKENAAETFVEMDSDIQELLIKSFSDAELGGLTDELFLDDTVDIIEEMPANVVKRILRAASPETRGQINELLKYPDDSAGSVMTTEYVELKADMLPSDAFRIIRETGTDKETIYTCYVTDGKKHLIGVVTVKDMLQSGEKPLGDIMETNVISANTLDDKEAVGKIFLDYGLMSLPVVDAENRLVGIVTYDDAMYVISSEKEEDIQVMAAITPSEDRYLKTSVFSLFKARIPWLLLLMVSATFTGMIISSFESALAVCTVLTAFIPMLMDTGGNTGSQSSVTVIRALSTNDITFRNIFRVQWKELRVSLLVGATLSVANFIKLYLVDNLLLHTSGLTVQVMAAVCITLFAVVVAAKFIGCTLPLLAHRIGFDPAVMASPFITTLVDAVSLLVYFRVAKLMLGI